MKIKLTREDAQEVSHKMSILADSQDLQDDYGLTKEQADTIDSSVPLNGGEWEVPDWALEAVKGEMQDHVRVLEDMAAECRAEDIGQSLRIAKQAKRLGRLFS